METYLPYRAFVNLELFFRQRSLQTLEKSRAVSELELPAWRNLSPEKFVRRIQQEGRLLIYALDHERVHPRRRLQKVIPEKRDWPVITLLILLDEWATEALKFSTLQTLLGRIPVFQKSALSAHVEILIFGKDDLPSKVEKKFQTLSFLEQGERGFRWLRYFPYYYLLLNPTQHKFIPRYRLYSEEEEKEYLAHALLEKKDCRRISVNTAVGVWLGAESGQLAEVNYLSEETLQQISVEMFQ